MGIIEIIAAIVLIIACIIIVAVVLMQESKQGMSNVITGGSNDNYFQKNSGRTKEAQLARFTKVAAITFFVVAIAVNVIAIYWGGSNTSDSITDKVADDIVIGDIEDSNSADDIIVEESENGEPDASEDTEGEAPAENGNETEETELPENSAE